MQTIRRHSAIVSAAILAIVAVWTPRANAEDPSGNSVSEQHIAQLVDELGDASYARRTEATRALCAIGAPATAALERVADGQHVEIALRAQAVLRVIEQLMFGGVEVRLAFSKKKISWGDPIDLTLKLTNRSAFPARVPFDIDPEVRQKATGDARHVGDMLDVAEYLRVLDGRGTSVPLTVDDIMGDLMVAKIVENRVDAGPIGTLAPGQAASTASP